MPCSPAPPRGRHCRDQETTYTYGVTTGQTPASKITVNNLLREAKYPDSSGGSDVVLYAYNAQGERISMHDQVGNEIDLEYDTGARITKRKVTNLGTNIDGAVRRIEYAYDSLGRQTTVTQYDAASAGNVVDQVEFTYADWGPPSVFKQDHDSAAGGSYLYQIDYTYAKATTGRNTIRRTGMTLPSGNVLTYQYSSTSDLHDDELSRVTRVQDGAVDLARYYYNGAGHVVGTDLPEADVQSRQYSGSTFPDLDRFNRIGRSEWEKDYGGGTVMFYDAAVSYDENSNVTVFDESVHAGFDVLYTMDDLDRLIDEQRGTYSGGSIATETLQQTWTLDQVGNWDHVTLDFNDDDVFGGAGEYDDDRTHNVVNELTGRDTDDNGSDNFTLTYDANGNLTDHGENYEYVYDAFNRLRKVKNTSTQALVAEYRYNGLNYRITSHEDTDGNGTVNGSDTILHFAYDERWRIVAVFEDSSSDPHEEFVHHNAGDSGFGTSSYIDAVVLRDRDADGDVNHDLEERIYYCQNWRHDVVALVTDTGKLVEQVRYDAYGGMTALPTGDTDSDGDWDSTDDNNITTSISYGVEKDANLDGAVSAADVTHANSITGGYQILGRGVLSSTGVKNARGHRGYVYAANLSGMKAHGRVRFLDSEQGRWTARDPLAEIEEANLYAAAEIHVIADIEGKPPTPSRPRPDSFYWRKDRHGDQCVPGETRNRKVIRTCTFRRWDFPFIRVKENGCKECEQEQVCRYFWKTEQFRWSHRPDMGDKEVCGRCDFCDKPTTPPSPGLPPCKGAPAIYPDHPCDRYRRDRSKVNCHKCCEEAFKNFPGLPSIGPGTGVTPPTLGDLVAICKAHCPP